MDIECIEEQQLFKAITIDQMNKIYNESIILQNQFVVNRNRKILLILTNNSIVICSCENNSPQSLILLDFSLKFEIIRRQKKNINSKIIGFTLMNQDCHSTSFYSGNLGELNAWIHILRTKINEKGFHQLFRPIKKLGKGSFASVYEVQRLTDGKKFAVKAFSKQNSYSVRNGKQGLINELQIMREYSHYNLLELEGVFESDNSIYVILNLLQGGQLFNRIQSKNGYFTDKQIGTFMYELLSGIQHLHSKRIIHRDIKPQNIMLRNSYSMSPVLIDFGLATQVDKQKYLFFRCGTPGYVAPEIISLNQHLHIEPQCDIFSVGVIFHIFLTRKPLFQGNRYQEVYQRNKEMNFNFNDHKYETINPQAINLMKQMLEIDVKKRITAQQALNHPYFKQFNFELFHETKSQVFTQTSTKFHQAIC